MSGTSLAVLAYLGFDGISTLSEEAKNPRDVLPATVIACVAIGLLSVLEVYAAQLVWPAAEHFPDIDTAFTSVAGRAWAPLFGVVGFTLIVACVGSGTGMQLGAARLLYSMGRSGAIPRKFFGSVEPKRRIPRNNVLFVGAIAFAGAIILPAIAGEATGFDLGASLLNFRRADLVHGCQYRGGLRAVLPARGAKKLYNLAAPVLGFIVCLHAVVESQPGSMDAGRSLDGDRHCRRRLEDAGLPHNLVSFDLPPDVLPETPKDLRGDGAAA
jgi:putrescine importer